MNTPSDSTAAPAPPGSELGAAGACFQLRPDEENPWIGLFSFTENIRDFFHGRAAESEALARMVGRKTLTVLYGESGLGKSSLLQAGLFPRLRAQSFLPVYIRLSFTEAGPGIAEAKAAIRLEIERAFARGELVAGTPEAAAGAAAPRADETFWEYLHRLREGDLRQPPGADGQPGDPVGLVLAFDQFEEIFTLGQLGRRGQRRGPVFDFLQDLTDCIENRLPARVKERLEARAAATGAEEPRRPERGRQAYRLILSLRKDFVAELDDLRDLMPTVMENRMLLRPLDGRQALDAVLLPGRRLVTPYVARRIVRFVANMKRSGPRADGGGEEEEEAGEERQLAELQVDPSLLSMVCRELNKKRQQQGQPEITRELVEQGSKTILNDFYEDCFLDQPAPAVRHFVEDCLLNEEDRRKAIELGQAEALLARAGVADPAAALQLLVQHRLLRMIEGVDHGPSQLELTHDVLCQVVSSKRRERETREQQEAEAAAQLAAAERQRAEAEAREQTARADQAAAEARLRQLRRERRLSMVFTSLLLTACVLIGLSWRGMRRAQAELTRQQRVASEANYQRALLKVSNAQPPAGPATATGSLPAPAPPLDQKGNAFALVHLARALADDPANHPAAALAYHLLGEKNWCPPLTPTLRSNRDDPWLAVTCSPDGQIAAVSQKGRLFQWKLAADGSVRATSRDLQAAGFQSAIFSRNGQWLLAGTKGQREARIWSWEEHAATYQPDPVLGKQPLSIDSDLRSVAWTPDGQWLLVVPVAAGSHCQLFRQNPATSAYEEIPNVLPHPERVMAVDFSANGRRIVTACYDGKARLWDIDDLQNPTQLLEPKDPNTGKLIVNDRVFFAAFSPDPEGRRVVTISGESQVRIWDTQSREETRLPLSFSRDGCLRAVFSPDGRRLLATTIR
ncbi:MAG: hypothetical protein JO295_08435, partial [Verrucomicrobia bacterium]|nr:hypothetical protein [Verrucomicrobiota bacterium]